MSTERIAEAGDVQDLCADVTHSRSCIFPPLAHHRYDGDSRTPSPRVFPSEHFRDVMGSILRCGDDKTCCYRNMRDPNASVYSTQKLIGRRGRTLYSSGQGRPCDQIIRFRSPSRQVRSAHGTTGIHSRESSWERRRRKRRSNKNSSCEGGRRRGETKDSSCESDHRRRKPKEDSSAESGHGRSFKHSIAPSEPRRSFAQSERGHKNSFQSVKKGSNERKRGSQKNSYDEGRNRGSVKGRRSADRANGSHRDPWDEGEDSWKNQRKSEQDGGKQRKSDEKSKHGPNQRDLANYHSEDEVKSTPTRLPVLKKPRIDQERVNREIKLTQERRRPAAAAATPPGKLPPVSHRVMKKSESPGKKLADAQWLKFPRIAQALVQEGRAGGSKGVCKSSNKKWNTADWLENPDENGAGDYSSWELATQLIRKPLKSLLGAIPPPPVLLAYIRKRFRTDEWPCGRPSGRRYYPDGTPFVASFPNGSALVFYPHGGLAIAITSPNPTHQILVFRDPLEGFYFLDKSLLGGFNTMGIGVAYSNQGVIRLRYDFDGGYRLEDGGEAQRWRWNVGGQRILQKLNAYLTLRILDLDSIHLVFNGNKRGVRLNIGTGHLINLVAPNDEPPKCRPWETKRGESGSTVGLKERKCPVANCDSWECCQVRSFNPCCSTPPCCCYAYCPTP